MQSVPPDLIGSSKTCIARRDFSPGKTRRSSRLSMYCPANCGALSSNNGSSPRSATRLTALCSFAIALPKIVCCNFCKGLFLTAGWRWVDRNYGKKKLRDLQSKKNQSIHFMPSLIRKLFHKSDASQKDGLTQPQREAIVDLLNYCIYADNL